MAGEALYYQHVKSETAAGGRGKWFKTLSKSTPWCGFGAVVSPWPELLATNGPQGTSVPQKSRGALEGMKGDETASASGLQRSPFNLQWDFAGMQQED